MHSTVVIKCISPIPSPAFSAMVFLFWVLCSSRKGLFSVRKCDRRRSIKGRRHYWPSFVISAHFPLRTDTSPLPIYIFNKFNLSPIFHTSNDSRFNEVLHIHRFTYSNIYGLNNENLWRCYYKNKYTEYNLKNNESLLYSLVSFWWFLVSLDENVHNYFLIWIAYLKITENSFKNYALKLINWLLKRGVSMYHVCIFLWMFIVHRFIWQLWTDF